MPYPLCPMPSRTSYESSKGYKWLYLLYGCCWLQLTDKDCITLSNFLLLTLVDEFYILNMKIKILRTVLDLSESPKPRLAIWWTIFLRFK